LFNIIIIGAGNIGAFYDTPESSEILTHAHAVKNSGFFNLLGFVDTDINKAIAAAELWGGQAFSSVDEVFLNNKVDAAVICTPEISHLSILHIVFKYMNNTGLVLLEKPITKTIEEASVMLDEYGNRNILVNYSRRYFTKINEIREKLNNGEFGKLLAGTAYYGKGINHNGTHIIDLLLYLFGLVEVHKVTNKIFDYFDDDPSVGAILKVKDTDFILQPIPCNKVTIFEIDFLFEKMRIVISSNEKSKIQYYKAIDSNIYPGDRPYVLHKDETLDSSEPLVNCYNHIVEILNKREEPRCSIKDGYNCIKICNKLLGSCDE